jgi:hypothetical protein
MATSCYTLTTITTHTASLLTSSSHPITVTVTVTSTTICPPHPHHRSHLHPFSPFQPFDPNDVIKACKDGDVDSVRRLLASFGKDAVLEAKGGDGETGLHWAVENGHQSLVDLLQQSGADVDKTSKTPFQWRVSSVV